MRSFIWRRHHVQVSIPTPGASDSEVVAVSVSKQMQSLGWSVKAGVCAHFSSTGPTSPPNFLPGMCTLVFLDKELPRQSSFGAFHGSAMSFHGFSWHCYGTAMGSHDDDMEPMIFHGRLQNFIGVYGSATVLPWALMAPTAMAIGMKLSRGIAMGPPNETAPWDQFFVCSFIREVCGTCVEPTKHLYSM